MDLFLGGGSFFFIGFAWIDRWLCVCCEVCEVGNGMEWNGYTVAFEEGEVFAVWKRD